MQLTKKGLIAFVIVLAMITAAPAMIAAQSGQNQGSGQGTGRERGAAPQALPQGGKEVDVEEAELEKFANVMKEMQKIQSSYGEDVKSAISDSSLSEKRFREIYGASQQGQNEKAEGQTDAETRQYKKLMTRIGKIQKQANEEMVQIVKDSGFTVKRFNSIRMALRTDPELGKRLKQHMQQ